MPQVRAENFERLGGLNMENLAVLVDRALALNEEINAKKKTLDELKATLQKCGLAELENTNTKYLKISGETGFCEVTYKTKFEIDNYSKLESNIDKKLIEDKIKRKQETKYEIEKNFKKALTMLCKGEYAPHDIESILCGLGLDDKARKMAHKKLKGEYAADLKVLQNLGCKGALEEELDVIKEQRNFELVSRYFDLEQTDIEEIKKAVYLEETLGITLNGKEAG